MDYVKLQLIASAQDFADRALKAYTEDDTRVILVNAAFSLEHLSKAYLYDLNPAFLADLKSNNNFDSLLHVTGHGDRAKKPKSPRTVGARDAVNRVQQVLPRLVVPKDRLDQLIDVRDGVVHTGYLDAKDTREILTAFLRYCNELYDDLGLDQGTRWGTHSDLVNSLISQSLTEIEHETQRRMAATRQRHEELMRQIPAHERAEVAAARAGLNVARRKGAYPRFTKCPVCNNEASLFGDYVTSEREGSASENEETEEISFTNPDTAFIAAEFQCGSCELVLDRDQMQAAGINARLNDEEFWPGIRYSSLPRT